MLRNIIQIRLVISCLSISRLVKAFKLAGVDATYCEINSTYGHDAFLLETEEKHIIKHFLNTASKGERGYNEAGTKNTDHEVISNWITPQASVWTLGAVMANC